MLTNMVGDIHAQKLVEIFTLARELILLQNGVQYGRKKMPKQKKRKAELVTIKDGKIVVRDSRMATEEQVKRWNTNFGRHAADMFWRWAD